MNERLTRPSPISRSPKVMVSSITLESWAMAGGANADAINVMTKQSASPRFIQAMSHVKFNSVVFVY